MTVSKSVRRGLVIEGGGAKGAFALGCMKAFQDREIEFSAVAGTSAGGLCAIIWSTGKVEEGIKAWKEIDHSGFFGRSPDGCLRRLIKVACVAGKLFVSYVKNVDPEGRPQIGRDVVFSLGVGLLAWFLYIDVLPFWGKLISVLCIPIVALCAFANELPVVGWDNRTRQLIVDGIVLLATTRLLVAVAWLVLTFAGLVTREIRIGLNELLVCGAILAVMRLPVRIETTLMEGKLLYTQVARFLQSDLRIPTYVTVAREFPPNSPHFALPTPGVFKAHYAALHAAPANLKAQFGYASAALPFGIFSHAVIDNKTYVDGGVADNTPVFPMVPHEIDELWLIRLRPGPFDVQEHTRNVLIQTLFADGPRMPQAPEVLNAWLSRVKIVVFAPRVSLGGLLTGTLNFNQRRTEALLRHGYRVAKAELRLYDIQAAAKPRVYRPRLAPLARWRLFRRALPPCSMLRLFARGDANSESLRDFHVPAGVRPPPGEEATPAWLFSVIIVWMFFISDALASEHPWKRAIWGTLLACFMFVLPNFWSRLKRNLGIAA
ncbi:patatin-like phospholipase family protein [Mesorhizobium shangrilense]|uniref:Patatin-like phospholipase family protein n=1 Tax=Mesorhizobium shangrilense TaxID=460060 RepID=A0ABV2DN58_9HYPH